jgi:hypothetical protein
MLWLWMIAALSQATASDGDCPLFAVTPQGQAIAVDAGQIRLPRGSLVQASCGIICEQATDQPVQVVSVNYWYQANEGPPLAERADLVCVPRAVLTPMKGKRLLVMDAPPDAEPMDTLTPGTVTEAVGVALPCSGGKVQLGEAQVGVFALQTARPISDTQLAQLRRVQGTFSALFAPISLSRVGISDWGYVGMPMVHERTSVEIEKAIVSESLLTDKQREKVVIAEGPKAVDGTPIYLHFLGTDARFSDRWAQPSTIDALLQLSRAWFDHCVANVSKHGAAFPVAACTLQIGDLAWYNDRRPDPLGHREHYTGECVDIRLFRDDAARYEAFWNKADDRPGRSDHYAPMITGQFLHFALKHAPVSHVFFNDPDLHVKFQQVTPRRGHDDHLHMCFAATPAPDPR